MAHREFFRETKNNLGLNKYQVRSTESIDKLLALIALTHLYCMTQSKEYSFSKGLRQAQNQIKKEQINWTYEKAKEQMELNEIFKVMKVS